MVSFIGIYAYTLTVSSSDLRKTNHEIHHIDNIY